MYCLGFGSCEYVCYFHNICKYVVETVTCYVMFCAAVILSLVCAGDLGDGRVVIPFVGSRL